MKFLFTEVWKGYLFISFPDIAERLVDEIFQYRLDRNENWFDGGFIVSGYWIYEMVKLNCSSLGTTNST